VLQALRPDQLKQFAAFLDGLSRDELASRFNPARMIELAIYPEHWQPTGKANERPIERLLDGYDELRAFVLTAAEADAGAIVYVC